MAAWASQRVAWASQTVLPEAPLAALITRGAVRRWRSEAFTGRGAIWDTLVIMTPHQILTLPNGLRLVTLPLAQLHSVTACVVVGCGGRHDPAGQAGLSHFLEHMLFRGSRGLGDTQAVALTFEQAGGSLEAATWRDHTSFSCSTHPSGLRAVLAALPTVLGRPALADIAIERRIVAEEMRAEVDADGGERELNALSRAAIWGQHPLARGILGSPQSLGRLRLPQLRAHHAAHYRAANMVLCVAGPLDVEAVQAQVRSAWAALPAGAVAAVPIALPPRFAPAAPMLWQPGPGPQAALQLTFPALPEEHPDFLAQEVLVGILDDGLGSRLPRAICGDRGLAYTLESGLDCYGDVGVYDIEMYVQPRRIGEAVTCVLTCLGELLAGGVTAAELRLARQRQLQALEFALDAPEELAHEYACNLFFGRRRDLASLKQGLLGLQRRDLDRVARQLFASGRVHLTGQGPVAASTLRRLRTQLRQFAATVGAQAGGGRRRAG